MAMTIADVHLLLPACPQLLRLSCVLSEGWSALPVAAGCCSGLLEFSVTVRPHDPKLRAAASTVPEPVSSPSCLSSSASASSMKAAETLLPSSQPSSTSPSRLTPSCSTSTWRAAGAALTLASFCLWPACLISVSIW